MPITLPNSGLVCPEAGDPSAQACQQIKDLFTYVDAIPTDTDPTENKCVAITQIGWVQQGDASEKNFKQVVSVPLNTNPYKSAISVVSEAGLKVNLCVEIDSFSTVCVFTNSPGAYTLIFG